MTIKIISLGAISINLILLALFLMKGGCAKNYVSITYDSCTDSIRCLYNGDADGECYIEYMDEEDATNVTVTLNSVIMAPVPLAVGVTYRYNATITTSSKIVLLILRANFTVRECGSESCDEMRVTNENISLMAVGLLVWIVSLVAALVFTVTQIKFINENHVKAYKISRILGVCGIVVLVAAIPFWISIGPVIGTQTDLCESTWQQARIAIIACSFSLSVISLILTCNSLVFLVYSYRHIIPLIKRHPSIIHREEIVMERRSTYSNPTRGEDFTNFTIKANPVFGFDLNTSSSESSKAEEAVDMDVVGYTNLKATDLASANKQKAAVVEQCSDGEIIGNRFAS